MAPGALLDEVELPKKSSQVPPYPGFDLDGMYSPDCPNPRVKWDGQDYLNRNRGSIDNWAFYGESVASPRPELRCPTRESVDNWTHGHHGTIKPIIDGFASPRPETAPPRIKAEAEDIARVSRGFRMCNLITKYGEFGATPRLARVKPEAEDTATTHKGGRMKKLVHSYGTLPASARGVPRVKVEGEENADLDKGKRMDKLIHSYAKQPLSARAVPRVKTEGEDNADLDKGKRMNKLIHKYGRMPLSARAVPRVKSEGEDNAELDKGKRMDRLMHSCETLPKSPRSPPRVKHVEGKTNSFRGRGSMGKIFRDIGNRSCIFKPGVKKKSYLKTAMM